MPRTWCRRFGARGGNGAVADVDNLAWKLAHGAPLKRRRCAARQLCAASAVRRRKENILNSTRAARTSSRRSFRPPGPFATPRSRCARDFPSARALINSGRLSVPTGQADSPLDTPDSDADWIRGPAPGRVMAMPRWGVRTKGWLIDRPGSSSRVSDLCGSQAPATGLPPNDRLPHRGRRTRCGSATMRAPART